MQFGTGSEKGSFTFHYIIDGKTISVFTIYTNGKLMLNYGWLSTRVSQEVLEEFHKKISEISIFKHIPADLSKWPSVTITKEFKNDIEKFKEAILWLKNKLGGGF
ncbi:hypothetical protein Asulf_01165 [Archaeoglobus sulfaticallidus PM70-1]|uniref:Uncharacterized protein n=1 Tax=Archaeoglobus sulfaticallidus PM70-1 TaxID=387631 RepID=N0BC15_9EURY|nr:hypothetical protein Asulf_01165 [Archaeoglobus sulfaticallidus PM70-1]